jgi:hypothetical protein
MIWSSVTAWRERYPAHDYYNRNLNLLPYKSANLIPGKFLS